MDNNQQSKAIAELSQAIAFKVDLNLLYLRAAFFETMEEYDKAIRDCRMALTIDPNHPESIELFHGKLAQHICREPS
ncbi:hypothetical protein CBR_g55363 [Chara braunii]|uniref:Uncharacterized protein n=1 Tax=Chara braunii TaxID=69332 RepID=A0A388MCY2_CHABU|nr:hypothetical protein CBR_g55363 [Chara braunii]|eukprot:GBG92426.1 hypothetical protein CBR_g55363 [Chara braunii]